MKNNKIYLILTILIMSVLSMLLTVSCETASAEFVENDAEIPISERQTLPWQEAYATLLREYAEKGHSINFILHDFDKNGIPELIVAGYTGFDEKPSSEGELIDAVYTFRDNEMLSLEYGESIINVGIYALAIRCGITSTPDNTPGVITYEIGPSAGTFGTSCYYNRIVIDGNKLVIDAHGAYYVDITTLHELFDDFGYVADPDILQSAIEENTYFLINDNSVSLEELHRVFGNRDERLDYFNINEENIREIIFSTQKEIELMPAHFSFNEYTLISELYEQVNDGLNVKISYPQIVNNENINTTDINNLIREAAINEYFEKWNVDNLTFEQLYNVENQGDNLLSIVFDVYAYVAETAHPTNTCYAVTINTNTAEKYNLSDFIESYEYLEDKISNGEYEVLGGELKIYNSDELVNFVQSRFKNIPLESNIQNFYIDSDGNICIIIYLPHAAGDYSILRIYHDNVSINSEDTSSNNVEQSQYYKITQTADYDYYYYLYDKNNNIVDEKCSGMRYPRISVDENNIVEVSVLSGTGISTKWTYYYDYNNNIFSDVFYSVFNRYENNIVYMVFKDNNYKVIVRDIFDSSKYYFEILDFQYNIANVIDPFVDIEFLDSGKQIKITYLLDDGENPEFFNLK